jgi:hypothetical protein
MARKSRSERYENTKERLEVAKRWRHDEGYEDKWRRMIDLYRGKTYWQSGGIGTPNDRISINMAFSTINVIAPSVAVNHPTITVAANREDDSDRAVFVEAIINYMWRHHDYRKPFRRTVKDFLIIGHGWVKVGWKFVEEERKRSEYEVDDDYNTSVESIDLWLR